MTVRKQMKHIAEVMNISQAAVCETAIIELYQKVFPHAQQKKPS